MIKQMIEKNVTSVYLDSIAPPPRTHLIRAGRLFYPAVAIILTTIGSIEFFLSNEFIAGLVWLAACVIFILFFFFLDYYLRRAKNNGKKAFWIFTWLYGPPIGIIAFLGSIALLLICVFLTKNTNPLSILFWPVLVFSLQIYMGRYRGPRQRLLLVLVALTTLAIALFFIVDLVSNGFNISEIYNQLLFQKKIKWNPGSSIASSLWLILFVVDSFYRIYRGSLYRARDSSVRAVLKNIQTQTDKETPLSENSFLQDTADKIFWLHNQHVVSLVLCERGDPRTDPIEIPGALSTNAAFAYTSLKVRAFAGVPQNLINEIKPWPATLGLTGLMVRSTNRTYILENNVKKKDTEYFHPNDWPIQTRSELVIPIRSGGHLFGMIDIQSKVSHDFSLDDVDALSAIARPLAAQMQEDMVAKLYEADKQLWEELSKLDTESKLIKSFSKYISDLAGVDITIYYPLAIGTGFPKREPYIFGFLRERDEIGDTNHRMSNIVTELVAKGKIKFQSVALQDLELSQPDKEGGIPFIVRENIHSMCFYPITMGWRKLGGLFLNYHAFEQFGSLRRLTINILTQTLAHHISRIRYNDSLFKKLSQPRFRLHHILNRSGLSKDQLNADFETIIKSAPQTRERIETLRFRILEGYKQAYFEGSVIDIDFEKDDLEARLQSFAGLVREENNIERPDLRILPYVDEKIEKEMADLKTILMALATEATFNAIKHSQANFIEIHIDRQPSNIHFSVMNDITTENMPNPDSFQGSLHGIMQMIDELKRGLFANENWEVHPKERTIKLSINIPALP